MTCAKTQGFLAKHKVTVTEQADAKKATIKGAAALDVLDGVDELYVAKGKKIEHVDLRKTKPDRAALLALLLGPTGNLRAPTLRRGRTLIIGFEEATYKKLLSGPLSPPGRGQGQGAAVAPATAARSVGRWSGALPGRDGPRPRRRAGSGDARPP
jgi:arsenate reductase-like glutaredoxin family protein